ncbi:hypothetical protein BDV34DRAFT_224670 [Aspergillus parasiticus]|uniref:Uncharacterized protein n=1 Tax=Aspergillus parasiticus TaxID=5067 RepID=A0A5N6DMR2_ASPPA|nr:hypothetical protein BDV34DRAFT_224670 [Aspergillus parasiticus]
MAKADGIYVLPHNRHIVVCQKMTLTPEAIIALIALFVACVPGIRFLFSRKPKICQWWSRDRGPEDPENSHPSPATPVEDHLPSLNASDHPPNNIYQLEPIYSFVQRFQCPSRRTSPQRIETGLLFYTQTINTDPLEETEPLANGANGGGILPVIEHHRQP